MNEINISIFEGVNLITFVITIGLAYFIRALVIKFERNNKIPPSK
jgi:hypothetical protein